MKYLKKLSSLWLLACSVLLTGCFDMAQDLWINQDGSGRMRYQLGISEQLAAMSGESDVCAGFYQDKTTLEHYPGVQTVAYDSKHEGGVQYCIVDITVKHFSDLVQLQTHVMKDSMPARHQAEFQTSMELIDKDDGTGQFRLFVENSARHANQDELQKHADHFANVLMAQVMSGRYWNVTLHAQEILSSNGDVVEKGKVVQWRIPLYDLMTDMNYARDMQAGFDLDWPWYKRLWKWVS
jgi:hypothetical protein